MAPGARSLRTGSVLGRQAVPCESKVGDAPRVNAVQGNDRSRVSWKKSLRRTLGLNERCACRTLRGVKSYLLAGLLAGGASLARGETLVDKLLADYESVRTVRCDVRRIVETPAGVVRHLSHVYFERPDRLHVQNVSPVERRYVADGEKLFYYVTGDPRGYAQEIEQLPRSWLVELRKVPGTAMEHLLRLVGAPEQELPPTEAYPVRKGYAFETGFAVLSVDAAGRLARIEFFDSPEMGSKWAQYEYTDFAEVCPGVWIACTHCAWVKRGAEELREMARFENLVVNEAIDPQLFVPARFFQGVEFVDSFDKLCQ